MKKIITALFLCFILPAFAQESGGIKFEKTLTFEQLLSKAKKENKLIFMDAMASWCGPCKMMEKNIFPQKKVGDFYNANFVNATFDMEKGEGMAIAAKYNVRSYPTYLFINGDGQLVSQNVGYMPENTFLELGKEAANANKSFGSMRERFEKGEKDPQFLINIIKLNSNSDYDFAKRASERYFKNKKDKIYTKEEASYLLSFVKSVDDPNYKIFIRDREALKGLYPDEAYLQFDNGLKMQKVIDTSIDGVSKTIKEQYFIDNATPIIGEEGAKISLQRLKMSYFDQIGKFPEYEKTVLEYFQNVDTIDSKDLLNAAKQFAEKATDPTSLKNAQIWAEKVVMKGENADNTYVLAKILQKNGKKEEAKMYAEYSISLAKKMELDASAAEKLLQDLK